ncbi:MAG: GAF domain-containing sensor histidine kinase [Anaerolineae bacterium]
MSSTSVSQSKQSKRTRSSRQSVTPTSTPTRTLQTSEFKIEWLYSNLRWFYLMAVTATLAISATITGDIEAVFSEPIIALLVFGATANLLVMLLLMRNTFNKPMSSFTLLLDISLTLGLIALTGGTESPLLFVAFTPIITTALRYSGWISLLLSGATAGAYWWSAVRVREIQSLPALLQSGNFFVFSRGLILLLAGVAVSQVGTKIKNLLNEERLEKERDAEAQIKAAHHRVRLIFELATTLSATLNHERVLQAALDVTQTGLRELLNRDVPQVQLILLFDLDNNLYVADARGLTHKDRQRRFPAAEGALAQVLESAEMIIVEEPGQDPELGSVVALHRCHEAIVVPLRAGFETYGVMVVASPETGVYSNDFQDLLEAVCSQTVMALQNAQLYQNLMEEKERLVAVEEDERKKLARDLHDGPTQVISAIAMRLNYTRLLLEKGESAKAEAEIRELEHKARNTAKVIRQMLFTLRPLILESQGLVPALEQYIAKLAETDDLPIHLEAEKDIDTVLSKEAQGALFYLIEEAITNARKHAEASDLWVRLYRQGTMHVIAEIEDNGKGFDVTAVQENYEERGSLGMMNLRERATLAGGKTVIQSTPGEGTKITVTIPTKDEYESYP